MRYLAIVLAATSSIIMASGDPETVVFIDPSIISCSPSTIKIGEYIEVKLGADHGKKLAIKRIEGNISLFMVVGAPPEEMNSFMTLDKFMKIREFQINEETTGFRWEEHGYNEYVFSEPGEYEIYVSQILESEVGGYKCEMRVLSP